MENAAKVYYSKAVDKRLGVKENSRKYYNSKKKKEGRKIMRKAKNLKKCMALAFAMMMLIGSNPVKAFAAKGDTYDVSGWSFKSYESWGSKIFVDYSVDIGGIATHNETLLSSVYDFSGVLSTQECAYILDKEVENHYFWGTLSGTLTVSASTLGALSGTLGVSGKNAEGSLTASFESKAPSYSFTCGKNSESTLSASVNAVGFFSCDLMISHYTNCYDENTHRVVDYHSDSDSWDLYDELDYGLLKK